MLKNGRDFLDEVTLKLDVSQKSFDKSRRLIK